MVCIDGKQAITAISAQAQKKESPVGNSFFCGRLQKIQPTCYEVCATKPVYQACSSRVTMSSCEGMRGLLLVQMSSSALAAMESRL